MNRKKLLQALEAKWGVKTTYLRVPSCAYEIQCEAGDFLIDRHGVIRDQEGREFSAEELLKQPQPETAEEQEPIRREELPLAGYEVELPLAGHTVASLRNLINMLASKEKLLVSAFCLTQPLVDRRMAEDLCQRNVEDMENFQAVWTEYAAMHCHGLKINFEKQTLAMTLFKEQLTLEEMTAFRDLTVCINESAKKLKHSSFKPAQEENPKYAFRTWLLRLGMKGDAFKTTRKVILARLSGSAAFRTPAEEEKHKARLLAKRLKQREEDGDVH